MSQYHPESLFREQLAVLFIGRLDASTLSSGRVKIAFSDRSQLLVKSARVGFPFPNPRKLVRAKS